MLPTQSRLIVNTTVAQPSRAAASAASMPACPAPITATSYFPAINRIEIPPYVNSQGIERQFRGVIHIFNRVFHRIKHRRGKLPANSPAIAHTARHTGKEQGSAVFDSGTLFPPCRRRLWKSKPIGKAIGKSEAARAAKKIIRPPTYTKPHRRFSLSPPLCKVRWVCVSKAGGVVSCHPNGDTQALSLLPSTPRSACRLTAPLTQGSQGEIHRLKS